jgi:hypothetical protein
VKLGLTAAALPVISSILAPSALQAQSCGPQTFANTKVFAYTGAAQPWNVPVCVSVLKVDVQGAQGGKNGGEGGRVQATLSVTPGEILMMFVGGAGAIGPTGGGFNGGGGSAGNGGGGGGASDIRRGSTKLIIASGGGGSASVAGGVGGGTAGAAGDFVYDQEYSRFIATGGGGGTQSGGGSPGSGIIGLGAIAATGGGGGTLAAVEVAPDTLPHLRPLLLREAEEVAAALPMPTRRQPASPTPQAVALVTDRSPSPGRGVCHSQR